MVTFRAETIDTLEQYTGLRIYIGENEILQYTFNQMGAQTVTKTLAERISGFNNGKYPVIECDTQALIYLRRPPERENFHACLSFHSARINWLMLSVNAARDLSEFEQAVLTEATAYAIAKNDDTVLEAELKGYNHLSELGCQIFYLNYNDFAEAATEILKNSPKYYNLWDWQLHEELRLLTR